MLTIPRKALRLSALAASMTAALWMAGCSTTSTQADANKGPAPITDAKPANNLNGNGANNNGVPSTAVKPVEVGNTSAADADASLARVVYFDFDSNVVKDEFRGVIEANAKRLSANSAKKITIEGHTDERGGREYNLALGQRRAEAVQKALGLLGANPAQMEAVSFGKERPAVQGSTEEAWAKNRRAEIKDR